MLDNKIQMTQKKTRKKRKEFRNKETRSESVVLSLSLSEQREPHSLKDYSHREECERNRQDANNPLAHSGKLGEEHCSLSQKIFHGHQN